MKTKCIELSTFESELLLSYIGQDRTAPIPASLCRVIHRRLEGQPVFASDPVQIHSTSVANTYLSADNR